MATQRKPEEKIEICYYCNLEQLYQDKLDQGGR